MESGLDTFVCPGTTSWKRILGAMDLAERNIETFARAGRRAGAKGLINTDWGDLGHFNMPACSWHGLALGAALGWSAEHVTGPGIRRDIRAVGVGSYGSCACGCLAIGECDRCETRDVAPCYGSPLREYWSNRSYRLSTHSRHFTERPRRARSLVTSVESSCTTSKRATDELALACRFSELCARKLLMIREQVDGARDQGNRVREIRQRRDEVMSCADQYAELWRAGRQGDRIVRHSSLRSMPPRST